MQHIETIYSIGVLLETETLRNNISQLLQQLARYYSRLIFIGLLYNTM